MKTLFHITLIISVFYLNTVKCQYRIGANSKTFSGFVMAICPIDGANSRWYSVAEHLDLSIRDFSGTLTAQVAYYRKRRIRSSVTCAYDKSRMLYVHTQEFNSWDDIEPGLKYDTYVHGFDIQTSSYMGYYQYNMSYRDTEQMASVGDLTVYIRNNEITDITTVNVVFPNEQRTAVVSQLLFTTSVSGGSAIVAVDNDTSNDVIIGGSNCLLSRYSISGELIWKASDISFISSGFCKPDRIAVDSANCFAVLGFQFTGALNHPNFQKYSYGVGYLAFNPSTGEFLWSRPFRYSYVPNNWVRITGLALDKVSKHIYVSGSCQSDNVGFTEVLSYYNEGTNISSQIIVNPNIISKEWNGGLGLRISNEAGLGVWGYGASYVSRFEIFMVPTYPVNSSSVDSSALSCGLPSQSTLSQKSSSSVSSTRTIKTPSSNQSDALTIPYFSYPWIAGFAVLAFAAAVGIKRYLTNRKEDKQASHFTSVPG